MDLLGDEEQALRAQVRFCANNSAVGSPGCARGGPGDEEELFDQRPREQPRQG